MIDKKTSITLKGTTKGFLADIGSKGDSYDDIVMGLLHERNIFMIHSLCKGQTLQEASSLIELEDRCKDIFFTIRFERVPPYIDGDGQMVEWESFDDAFKWAIGMGLDEDLIGHNREDDITMAEAVTNVYCLMNDIPSPTFGNGAMKNPLAP